MALHYPRFYTSLDNFIHGLSGFTVSLHSGFPWAGLGWVGVMSGITVGVPLSFIVLKFMARRSEADGRTAFIVDMIRHYGLRLLYISSFLRDIFLLLSYVHQRGTAISECQSKSFLAFYISKLAFDSSR